MGKITHPKEKEKYFFCSLFHWYGKKNHSFFVIFKFSLASFSISFPHCPFHRRSSIDQHKRANQGFSLLLFSPATTEKRRKKYLFPSTPTNNHSSFSSGFISAAALSQLEYLVGRARAAGSFSQKKGEWEKRSELRKKAPHFFCANSGPGGGFRIKKVVVVSARRPPPPPPLPLGVVGCWPTKVPRGTKRARATDLPSFGELLRSLKALFPAKF